VLDYFCLEGVELRGFKRKVENFDLAENINKLSKIRKHLKGKNK